MKKMLSLVLSLLIVFSLTACGGGDGGSGGKKDSGLPGIDMKSTEVQTVSADRATLDVLNETFLSEDYLNTINDKISKLKTSTSDEALSSIKSEANQMKKAADAVTALDYDKTSGDAVYSKVKDLVNTYNALAKQTGKSDLVSISQSRTWMVNDTKAHEAQWNKIGITIEDDQTLTIDEKKFKEASTSDIKNFLSGASGYASRLSTKANGFYQLASNQLTLNSGTSLYNKYGLLG